MKKIYTFFFSVFFLFLASPVFASTELLTSPWHISISGGSDVNLYQSIPANSLNGKQSLTLTYDLHGSCIRNSLDSAIIFDQNPSGWHTVSLYNYGDHCKNGVQTVTIPLTDFSPALDTTANVGTFHTRFWYATPLTVDITSAQLDPKPANWSMQVVDGMKYQKDVVCNPPSQATIDTMTQKAKDLGANFMTVDVPYDSPSCGNAQALTDKWVTSIRSRGLHIWFRQMGTAFEGIYSKPKTSTDYLEQISAYILAHPTQYQAGDIFTPTPEPDSAGINGVTYCGNPAKCAFSSTAQFNQWIRDAQLVSKLSFTQIGLPNMAIGYYGTSGFIVFGENNPDWIGKGFLEQSTVDSMGGVIAMDTYPESYGGTMATALDGAHAKWPNATYVIGEWGTITATTSAQAITQVDNSMGAAKRPYVTGFNYWNLGPSGHEGLLNTDLTPNSVFTEVQKFFTGLL